MYKGDRLNITNPVLVLTNSKHLFCLYYQDKYFKFWIRKAKTVSRVKLPYRAYRIASVPVLFQSSHNDTQQIIRKLRHSCQGTPCE